MVLSARKWFSRFVFMLLFIGLFVVATGGYDWLVDVVSPSNPYEVPQGEAVKAIWHSTYEWDNGNIADRLRFFYWYGE